MGCLKLDISSENQSPLRVVWKNPESQKPGVTNFLATKNLCVNYYAGGMMQPKRCYSDASTRGFGGQERDDEIYGQGNAYTAEYWEYDSRLGRRWNIDPVVKPWESPYACFNNNPIYYNDPLGLDGDPPKDGDVYECGDGSIEVFDSRSGGYFPTLPAVEIIGYRTKYKVNIVKEYDEPTVFQNIFGWLGGVEKSMRGNAYWTFGVEFNTKDGESNGNTANPIAPKDFGNVLTIENWDEVNDLLDILGVTLGSDAQNNPFQTYSVSRPAGIVDYNTLRSKWKGTGRNSPKEASKRFKALQKRVDILNNTYKNKYPGSTQIGGFNVNGNTPAIERTTSGTIDVINRDTIYERIIKPDHSYKMGIIRENGQPVDSIHYMPD